MNLTDQTGRRAKILFERGLLTAAEQTALEWLESARGPEEQAPAVLLVGRVRLKAGRLREALDDLSRAVELIPPEELNWLARCLTDLSDALYQLGDPDGAEEQARMAVGLEAKIDRVAGSTLGDAWGRLGDALSQKGLLVQAVEAFRSALRYYHQTGEPIGEARALSALGVTEVETGDLEAARRHLQESFQVLSPTGTALTRNCTELARLNLIAGRISEAVLMANQALQSLLDDIAVLDPAEVARVCEVYGLIFARSGAGNQALKYLNLAAGYFSVAGQVREWERSVSEVRGILGRLGAAEPVPTNYLQDQLDFLTEIMRLTEDLERMDLGFRGHLERVTTLAVTIGRQMGLDPLNLTFLRHAARLHDAGMTALDPKVFAHRELLTSEQRLQLQSHLDHGRGVLMTLRLQQPELDAVYYHHERYDGTGYPAGMAGRDIPLLSRIIALAEAYDAMTSPRQFREAFSHRQAVEEILSLNGSQFCPDCVTSLIRVFELEP